MSTLVYVDQKTTIAMAVPLIGLQSQRNVQHGQNIGFNWLIQSQLSRGTSSSIFQDIRELLPEELAHGVLAALPDERKQLSTRDAVKLLSLTGETRLVPGNPISIQGVLHISGIEQMPQFNPFNPPEIDVPTFKFHGENCYSAQLNSEGHRLPVYFDEASKAQVAYCHNNPVELTGVMRWCPPYSPGGAAVLQLALRVAAIWLV